jgi:hypothetical protein
MAENYQKVEFQDELLADKTISRVYSSGVREWRRRLDDDQIEWRDSAGARGTDELLGDLIIKRTFSDGRALYGREQGYGRTLWSNNVLTLNRTSYGGNVGAALMAVGGAALVGGLVAPPLVLSATEEAALRQQRQQQHQSSGGSSSGGDSDWDDAGDAGDADSDFG